MNKLLSRTVSKMCFKRNYSYSSDLAVKLGIPLYKERKPSDLLKAIASTVGNDPTAASYKFVDDPYMHPYSLKEKKEFALARESGKKAATWIRDENPELFHQEFAVPKIPEFDRPLAINEEIKVNEDILIELINSLEITSAKKVYELCIMNGVEISQETQQSLLECIAYYQERTPSNLAWTEELANRDLDDSYGSGYEWKSNNLADDLFQALKGNGSKPYCAMIRGLCLNGQGERSMELYNEALENNLTLDTETFNFIIMHGTRMLYDGSARWNHVESVMHTMVKQNVAPNLNTFNKALAVLDSAKNWKNAIHISLNIISEMKRININPSLTSYLHCINLQYQKSTKNSWSPHFMNFVITALEKKRYLSVNDPMDIHFFNKAMYICVENLKDWSLCERLHCLLLLNNNGELLSGTINESQYYKQYYSMALKKLPIDEFMSLYDFLVPNIYSPSIHNVRDTIKEIALTEKIHYLVRVWKNVDLSNLSGIDYVVSVFLIVINNVNWDKVDDDVRMDLISYVNKFFDAHQLMETDDDQKRSFKWNGKILGTLMEIFSKHYPLDKIIEILNPLIDNPTITMDPIPDNHVVSVFNTALKADNGKICYLLHRYSLRNSLDCTNYLKEQMEKAFDIEEN